MNPRNGLQSRFRVSEGLGPDHGVTEIEQGRHGQDGGEVEDHRNGSTCIAVGSNLVARCDQTEEQGKDHGTQGKRRDGHHLFRLPSSSVCAKDVVQPPRRHHQKSGDQGNRDHRIEVQGHDISMILPVRNRLAREQYTLPSTRSLVRVTRPIPRGQERVGRFEDQAPVPDRSRVLQAITPPYR